MHSMHINCNVLQFVHNFRDYAYKLQCFTVCIQFPRLYVRTDTHMYIAKGVNSLLVSGNLKEKKLKDNCPMTFDFSKWNSGWPKLHDMSIQMMYYSDCEVDECAVDYLKTVSIRFQ